MTPHPIIIDCDPGIDDAIAILTALASPELDVLGINVVSGNVPIEATLRNALQICELAGRPEIPVHGGCHRPLLREPIFGQYSGTDGLGGMDLPLPRKAVEATHAVAFLIDRLDAAITAGTRITLCTMGPLTNVAVALRMRPDITRGLDRIVMMGGAYREAGNRTMTSEFNILVDPHAAHVVFSSEVPVTALGLDASHQALATPDRVAAIRALGGRVCGLVADLLTYWDRNDTRRYGGPGGPLHDPLVIGYLLWPEMFETQRTRVFVEHESERTIGQTIADWYGKSGEAPNTDVATRVDSDAFYRALGERLSRYTETVGA